MGLAALRDKEKAGSAGSFVKLNDGDSFVGIVCGEPKKKELVFIDGKYQDYVREDHGDLKPSVKFSIPFFLPNQLRVATFDAPLSVFYALADLEDEYGEEKFATLAVKIKREGSGQSTKYSTVTSPVDVSGDVLKSLESCRKELKETSDAENAIPF